MQGGSGASTQACKKALPSLATRPPRSAGRQACKLCASPGARRLTSPVAGRLAAEGQAHQHQAVPHHNHLVQLDRLRYKHCRTTHAPRTHPPAERSFQRAKTQSPNLASLKKKHNAERVRCGRGAGPRMWEPEP